MAMPGGAFGDGEVDLVLVEMIQRLVDQGASFGLFDLGRAGVGVRPLSVLRQMVTQATINAAFIKFLDSEFAGGATGCPLSADERIRFAWLKSAGEALSINGQQLSDRIREWQGGDDEFAAHPPGVGKRFSPIINNLWEAVAPEKAGYSPWSIALASIFAAATAYYGSLTFEAAGSSAADLVPFASWSAGLVGWSCKWVNVALGGYFTFRQSIKPFEWVARKIGLSSKPAEEVDGKGKIITSCVLAAFGAGVFGLLSAREHLSAGKVFCAWLSNATQMQAGQEVLLDSFVAWLKKSRQTVEGGYVSLDDGEKVKKELLFRLQGIVMRIKAGNSEEVTVGSADFNKDAWIAFDSNVVQKLYDADSDVAKQLKSLREGTHTVQELIAVSIGPEGGLQLPEHIANMQIRDFLSVFAPELIKDGQAWYANSTLWKVIGRIAAHGGYFPYCIATVIDGGKYIPGLFELGGTTGGNVLGVVLGSVSALIYLGIIDLNALFFAKGMSTVLDLFSDLSSSDISCPAVTIAMTQVAFSVAAVFFSFLSSATAISRLKDVFTFFGAKFATSAPLDKTLSIWTASAGTIFNGAACISEAVKGMDQLKRLCEMSAGQRAKLSRVEDLIAKLEKMPATDFGSLSLSEVPVDISLLENMLGITPEMKDAMARQRGSRSAMVVYQSDSAHGRGAKSGVCRLGDSTP